MLLSSPQGSLLPPAPYGGRRRARTVAALAGVVAATLMALPAGLAAAKTPTVTGSPSPTSPHVSHSPQPVVSPWAGPLTTPCPPVPKSTAGPAVSTAPSAFPTT